MMSFVASVSILLAFGAVPAYAGITQERPQTGYPDTPWYDLRVTLTPDAHRLTASGTVRLPASPRQRRAIQLVLAETMTEFIAEVLEPRASRGTARLERAGTQWTLVPRSPLAAGQPVVIRFAYAGGEKPGFVFYLGPEGSFAGGPNTAWYPQIVDSADGRLRGTGRLWFSVPDGITTVASGTPLPGSNPREFAFEVKVPDYFSFAAGKYTVLRREGVVSTSVYLLRPRAHAMDYLEGCTRILELLTREYGPYPYGGHFAIVEAPMEKAGGSTGASLASFMLTGSTSLDAPFNPTFYGHEIGHVWWGNLLRQKGQRGRLVLDEGMAQYSALISLEALRGPVAARDFRRHGDPASPLDVSASTWFALAEAGLDHPLANLPAEWNSRQLASTKFPLVMDLLARTVGRERFRAALHDLTRRHAFGSITWDDFAAAFDGSGAGQLQGFFAQWFDREGAPDWRVEWQQDGKALRAAITQEQPYFAGTVDLRITGEDGREMTRAIEIGARARTEFVWPIDFRPVGAEIDPDFRVLRWTEEYRAEAPLLAPYWQAFVRSSSDATNDSALAILSAALERTPDSETVGARFVLHELTARLLFSEPKRLEEAKRHLERGLMSASRRTTRLGFAYYLLGLIASRLGDRATLDFAIQGAVGADALNASWSEWGGATRALIQTKP